MVMAPFIYNLLSLIYSSALFYLAQFICGISLFFCLYFNDFVKHVVAFVLSFSTSVTNNIIVSTVLMAIIVCLPQNVSDKLGELLLSFSTFKNTPIEVFAQQSYIYVQDKHISPNIAKINFYFGKSTLEF